MRFEWEGVCNDPVAIALGTALVAIACGTDLGAVDIGADLGVTRDKCLVVPESNV